MWSVLTAVFVTVLVVMLVLTEVAGMYAPVINATLHCETSKIIPGDGTADTNYYPIEYSDAKKAREYVDSVVRETEGEGLVLLKNEGGAPLSAGDSVSLFGTASVNVNASTQGTPLNTDKTEYPTLREALEQDGVKVNETLWNFYLSNGSYGVSRSKINEIPWSAYSPAVKNSMQGTAAVIVLTRYSGEGQDVKATGTDGAGGNYLALSKEETDLLKNVTTLKKQGKFEKVVLLLNTALTIQMDFLDDSQIDIDTCMWIGNVGSSGIYAVADALVGKVNPSGRLTDTYVKDSFASPAAQYLYLTDKKSVSQRYSGDTSSLEGTQYNYTAYIEGIYVGYRYFETRYEDALLGNGNAGDYAYEDDVAYPFGHGLSYTQFEYSDFTISDRSENGTYDVSVTVKNIGETPGKHSVQVYLQKPYIRNGVEKAAVELVGIAKTEELEPQGTETVRVTVEEELFASYDSNDAGTYILDAGEYYLAVGENAHDALNNILAARGETGMTDYTGAPCDGNELLADVALDQVSYDASVYSASGETGYEIVNQLDSCDMNLYDGAKDNAIRYVTRSDWAGTYPKDTVDFSVNEFIIEDLGNITEDDLAAKGYETVDEMPEFGKNGSYTIASLRSDEEEIIPITDGRWSELMDQVSFDELNTLLSTAICQTAGVPSVAKPQTKDSDGPAYVKDIGEGGTDTGARLPCEGIIAATCNVELIEKLGSAFAVDAQASKVHGVYAPGVNIHRTPFGGRNSEYFSEDPVLSGISAQYEIRGIQSRGVIAYVKHFVFNESDDNRDGICVWLNEQEAREIMLTPFRYATEPSKGNAHAVMTSFNRAGCTWTSANAGLVTEILRNEWGFDGYVITDYYDNDVQFMRPLDGIMAGTDCWLGNGLISFEDYKDNPTVCARMKEAAKRIFYITANYNYVMNGMDSAARVVNITPWWQIIIYSADAVFAVLAAAAVAMYAASVIKTVRPAENRKGGRS